MSHQVTNDQKPAVADRNGDFAPIDSSDPIFWATEHGAKKKQPFGAMSPSRGYSKFAEKWWSSKRWLATLVPDRPLFWVTRWYAFPMVFL